MTCEFSLAHYRELLEAAQTGGYRYAGFDRAPEPGDLILRHDVDLSLEAAVAMEDRNQILAAQTGDFREGVMAFLQKRPARYEDQ